MSAPTHFPRNRQRTKCAEKNDKLGWTCGFVFTFNKGTVGVRSNDPGVLERVRRSLPPGFECSESDDEVDLLFSFRNGRCAQQKLGRGSRHYSLAYRDWTMVHRSDDHARAESIFRKSMLSDLLGLGYGLAALESRVFIGSGRAILLLADTEELVSYLESRGLALGSLASPPMSPFDEQGFFLGQLSSQTAREHLQNIEITDVIVGKGISDECSANSGRPCVPAALVTLLLKQTHGWLSPLSKIRGLAKVISSARLHLIEDGSIDPTRLDQTLSLNPNGPNERIPGNG